MNLLLIGFYYLNFYVLIPKLLTKGRRWQYFSSVGVMFVVLLFLLNMMRYAFFNLPSDAHPAIPHNGPGIFGAFVMFGLVWAASSGIRLNTEWSKAEARRRESENARLNAELAQLKSQLNPHFLFNTLNGIYTLTLAKNDAAPDAVLKLSHLLRYVMAETDADFVPLEKDLEHLRHFIELHRMRLTAKTPVTFQVEGDPADKQIAPLLLLPFVENAFKYGASAREVSPIDISLKIKNQTLYFYCQNLVRNRPNDSSGIGVANTRRRLDLLYPEKYELDISEADGVFKVALQINIATNQQLTTNNQQRN
ncbi:MAG: histidine kinase [Saprospiraceae bacterium]